MRAAGRSSCNRPAVCDGQWLIGKGFVLSIQADEKTLERLSQIRLKTPAWRGVVDQPEGTTGMGMRDPGATMTSANK